MKRKKKADELMNIIEGLNEVIAHITVEGKTDKTKAMAKKLADRCLKFKDKLGKSNPPQKS